MRVEFPVASLVVKFACQDFAPVFPIVQIVPFGSREQTVCFAVIISFINSAVIIFDGGSVYRKVFIGDGFSSGGSGLVINSARQGGHHDVSIVGKSAFGFEGGSIFGFDVRIFWDDCIGDFAVILARIVGFKAVAVVATGHA